MANLLELTTYLNDFLAIQTFKDYCPNGLQVEGVPEVQTLVSGVTACEALIDQAIAVGADAVLVHHGYFWKGENPCIVGPKARRLQKLLENDISLLAYHLPLDAHPEVGNNVGLADQCGFKVTGELPMELTPSIGLMGTLHSAKAPVDFQQHLENCLEHSAFHIEAETPSIQQLAWVTGAGQDFIEQAALAGCDAFISGEVSERTTHLARELGIHYFACGHHATERFGVQALGEHLAKQFHLKYQYIDIDNPV